MKEIHFKFNDTKKSNSNSPLKFYEKNLFKNERHKKKSNSNNPLHFIKETPIKMNGHKKI